MEAVLAAEAPEVGDGGVQLGGDVLEPHVEHGTDDSPFRVLTLLLAGHGGGGILVRVLLCLMGRGERVAGIII
jgi:hypothetical protein